MVMPRVPILVILGATGSGKSRLGIELAQRFSGEVISADSMQIYKGLDIITAKVTPEERSMAPHHMLDEVDPLVNYCVIDFRNKAVKIINDLVSRRKMPIIVGGTNYYIESLLWQILVEDPKVSGNVDATGTPKKTGTPIKISHPDGEATVSVADSAKECEKSTVAEIGEGNENDTGIATKRRKIVDEEANFTMVPKLERKMRYDEDTITNEKLHQMLLDVDPEMARRLHPNNRRKVIRSLQVFEDHGEKHSEILKAQREAGGSGLGGPLRYPDSIIFWIQSDMAVLDERLNERVESMVKAGLVKELLDFHERYNQERLKTNTLPDYTKGIFQSIGFKEFHNYLVLSDDEKSSEKGEQLLKQGIEDLKLVTRRYARRQQRWVTNRFIRRVDRQVPPVYGLDCTNVSEWDSRVLGPATAIVEAVLRGEKPNAKPLNENIDREKHSDSSNEESHWCEICGKVLIGELQWTAHINGAKHSRALQKRKRFEDAEKKAQEMNISATDT